MSKLGIAVAAVLCALAFGSGSQASGDLPGFGERVASADAGLSVPDPPRNLTASVNGGTVSLSWDAPAEPVSSFLIEVGATSGATDLARFDTGSSATAFGGQAGAGTYYVRVRGVNVEGLGPASNEVVIVIGGTCASPPPAPSGLTVLESAAGRLTVTWTGVSAAQSYVLEAGSGSGLANLANADIGRVTSFTATAVPDGVYFLRIRARGPCGLSAPSNEVSVSMAAALSAEFRAVIDGLLFSSGPFSETGRRTNTTLTMWPDGVPITVRISSELSLPARQVAQDFVARYVALTNGRVQANVEVTLNPMRSAEFDTAPPNTLLLRVFPGFCAGTPACNTGGPPGGGHPGWSVSTFHSTDPGPYLIAHELGHAFGMWHFNLPTGSPVPLPLMAGARSGGVRRPVEGVLTDLEVRAILTVRNAGLRNGARRNDAIALGLIDPP